VNRPPGVRPLFRLPWRSRREVAADVDDELRFHLEHTAAELRRAGWSDADAQMEAARRFGDVNFTRDYCRAEDIRRERGKRRMNFFDELSQDLRYGFRALRRSPGFAATALLTLALGIGANTAIFSVVRGVLLEPLPFADPDRLVRIWHAQPTQGITQGSVSEPDFLDWRAQSQLAQSMGGYFFMDGLSGLDLTGTGSPERLSVGLATEGFFETLGTPAFIGRPLRADEHVASRSRSVVLSHEFWTRRFGGQQSLVGQNITLNAEPFQVVGVMPPGFTYPADRAIDAWIPLAFFGPDAIGRVRGAHFMGVIARLKPGVTVPQLQAELATIAARLTRDYPDNPGWTSVTLMPLRESILGEVRRPLIVLMVAVALLLLVACVNLASLLLARATGRRQELAVRAALGAGRGRIARQLLTESLTLAILGGVLGIALGVVAVRALAAAGASELPRAGDIRVDSTVLLFTLAVSILAGLLFGIMPALRASSDLERSLRAGGRGSLGGSGQKLRSGLVVAEVALAVILIIGAGLATKSFARLSSVDPGFEPSNALVVTLSVPDRYATPEASADYRYRVLNAVRAVPGVQAAGSIRDLPLRGNGEMNRATIPGLTTSDAGAPTFQRHHVSTDFFKAMGIPLRAGRTFEMTDRAGAPLVFVVNEEAARRFWPGENAVGKAIRFGTTDIRVVGVVGNVRQRGLAEPYEPAVYVHVLQNSRSRMSIVVRTSGDPLQYADAVRKAIWSQDAYQTITSVTTLESVLGSAVTRPRLLAWLLALFGVIGLTLGAVGIFGVLAYAVTQRRQEIGVRVALGAPPRSVLGLVVGQGMLLTSIGVAVGVLVASVLTKSMQSVLFDIRPSDPITFVQVSLVLLAAALLASWLPARRALAIDPVSALRAD
jgi:predicted permease